MNANAVLPWHKVIQIDNEDIHLDRLFDNRQLRRLVAVEVKIGEFKAACKGEVELARAGSTKTSGGASLLEITLCIGKKHKQIKFCALCLPRAT
ncbi:hypothetical protein LU699_00125 [Luteimonas fraxinea]|uniref:hypothetical protein n=1 Tax=Luteimonas fraxinea TaxID=2901869 RepID=UPI001E476C73|nr:hypothetical protein [Luteimonas fraxinea]UHH10188.1 hypothetical protein LU699_00125 [Luteimonas fraxinea]